MRAFCRWAVRGLVAAGILAGAPVVHAVGNPTFQFPVISNVGGSPQVQSVPVSIQTGGTPTGVRVVTQGKANADFVAGSGGSCVLGQAYLAGSSCTVTVQFAPLAPGERRGAVLLLDGQGIALGTEMLDGVGRGPLGVLLPGTMQTVAGNGTWLYRGDAVPATSASIFLPGGVAVDGGGNIFLSDTSNNRIRRVDAGTGMISTVAGTGTPGYQGDGGPGTGAAVNLPSGMVIDGAGGVIFADSGNHAVRKLTLATGVLSTIAGQLGQQGSSGDGLAATSAMLNTPEGVAIDAVGNLYIADTNNNSICKVDATTGILTTVVGAGRAAGFGNPPPPGNLNAPWGIALDPAGDLFIADLGNNVVRELTAGGVYSTFAGTGTAGYNGDQQAATAANLKGPAAVIVDVAGDLYIADAGNNLIRKVAAGSGQISTAAGTGSPIFSGDLGPATLAGMYGPYALALDAAGNVFFSDIFHHRIREIENSLAYLKYPAIRVGRTSAPQPVTFENDGNATLHVSAVAPDLNSAIDPGTTTCAVSSPLGVGSTCVVGAEFAPQITGNPVTAAIQIQSDAANSAGVISLSGEVDALDPTHTVVTANVNPVALGAPVTFTAVVSGSGSTAPAGNVRFFDGTTLLGTTATNANSTATFSISTLTLGTHAITAAFTGDAANSPSTSAVLNEVVKQTPVVTVVSSATPSQVGGSITFTATVTGPSVVPVGIVVFSDGGSVLGNGTLNSSGVATFTTTTLGAGTHTITASFAGDPSTLSGSSAGLSQVVNRWSTTTALSASSATSTIGTPIIFTVQVTTTSSVAPSGPVVLQDGNVILATLALDGRGAASYSTSTLAVGAHSIQAHFQGDPTNDVSASAVVTETVQQIGTTTVLTASANPASAGATLRLTANVTAASANPIAGAMTGVVTFAEGGVTLGAGNVAAGVATFDLSTLPVGSHTIVATYAGDTNHSGSASTGLVEAVQLASTTVQLSSSTNPSIAGRGITVTAVVSGTGGVPTGTMTFYDGTTVVGTGAVNGSGQASVSLAALGAGSHSLTASYGGDTKDSASVSTPLVQVVQQTVTTVVLTSSADPSFAGASVTFVATLTSNGSLPAGQIVLRDAGTVIGTATMGSTGSASFSIATLAAGSHTLVASYAGDTDHAASDSPALTQVVQIGTSAVTLTSSGNPSIFGNAVTFTVVLSGTANQPTGTVALMDGPATLATLTPNGSGLATFMTTTLAIGDHPLTAVYAGDPTHTGASHGLTQRVQQATTATLASSENPSLVGDTVQLTATIGGASGAPISGTVSFADGATVLGTAAVTGGVAVLPVATLAAGSHLIVATYSGDATNVAATSAALSQGVNTAGTSIVLTSSANPSVAGSAVTFSAAVTSVGKVPTGIVTFLDGSTTIGTGTVANGVATFTTTALAAGQHAIMARYGGDSGTQVSTSNLLVQVTQRRTTLALASSVNPALTVQGIVLTVTVGNGFQATGVVTFTDAGTQIGSVALRTDGTATLTLPSLASGSHTLAASYAGDSYNLPSTAAAVTEIVNLRPTVTTMTVSSDTYLSGQQITLVGVVQSNGPVPSTGTVTFTSGTTSLGSAPVSASGAATLTIFPLADSYSIVAAYSGDAVYSGSAAAAYSIKAGPSNTFILTPSSTSWSMASGTHQQIDLTITSVKDFTDVLALGCLELPIDATCTFSQDKTPLAAGGTNVIHLTIDTGNPLGAGGTAALRGSGWFASRSGPMEAGLLLPGAVLLACALPWAWRRKALPHLFGALCLVGVGFGISGCANKLVQNTTPAGSYTIRIQASGTQSGASKIADLAVTVTQ